MHPCEGSNCPLISNVWYTLKNCAHTNVLPISMNTIMTKYSFSGHETFHCRQFWLKKGYDFVKQQGQFSDRDAVAALGVGRNMVTSIQFWLKSFGLIDDVQRTTAIADLIFGENGKDPYLENIGTLWLLHYLLVTTKYASIYSLVFNEFRKERIEFTKEQVTNFLERKCKESEQNISRGSLQRDVDVFVKNYLRPLSKSGNVEDDFSALLLDLDLLQEMDRSSGAGNLFKIESYERTDLPAEILLYCILDQEEGNSISTDSLLIHEDGVGLIFALTRGALIQKINEMTTKFPGVTFTEDAGIREIQFIERPDPRVVLEQYYAA